MASIALRPARQKPGHSGDVVCCDRSRNYGLPTCCLDRRAKRVQLAVKYSPGVLVISIIRAFRIRIVDLYRLFLRAGMVDLDRLFLRTGIMDLDDRFLSFLNSGE